MKSGSLNLLEPSGPVQACNGIALPFTFYIDISLIVFYLTTWNQKQIQLAKSACTEHRLEHECAGTVQASRHPAGQISCIHFIEQAECGRPQQA
jgi:hypothetical protein